MAGSLDGVAVAGAAPQSTVVEIKQAPIIAASFSPPHVWCPRPWERVPVVPFASRNRQRKIWKRVAGAGPLLPDTKYRRAVAELESQCACPRKRARDESYVAAWGDSPWEASSNDAHDGAGDLVEARAAISSALESSRSNQSAALGLTHATFPEGTLKWVPRKRHNTRWPIEPKAANTKMVGAMQPLIEFDVPVMAEPVDTTQRINTEKLGKRSTRRLSRRISLFPGDMSPQKGSLITLTPAEALQPAVSPVKRSPLAPASATDAESTLSSFKVNATPVKVVLESPKTTVPNESPLKSSPPPATPKAAPAVVISHAPVVFDQPLPEASGEPQYEARRRRSLHAARRTDRRLSGPLRLLAAEPAKDIPNRRHSFTPSSGPSFDAKTRRLTLDAFFTIQDARDEFIASRARDNKAAVSDHEDLTSKMDGTKMPCTVFKIDAGTNLDIFGQYQKSPMSSAPVPQLCDAIPLSPQPTAHHSSEDASGPSTPEISIATDLDLASPIQNVLGVTYAASTDESAWDQAATYPGPDAVEAEQHNSDSDFLSHPAPTEDHSPVLGQEDNHAVFDPQDPEGLFTIYEESSVVMEADNSGVSRVASPLGGDEGEPSSPDDSFSERLSSSPSAASSGNIAQVDGYPQSMHTAGEAESRELSDHASGMVNNEQSAAETSTNHVVSAVDVLFNPDSPARALDSTTPVSDVLALPGSENMENNESSPSPSEKPIATPGSATQLPAFDTTTEKHEVPVITMGSSLSTKSSHDDLHGQDSTCDPAQTPLSASRHGASEQASTPSRDMVTPPAPAHSKAETAEEAGDQCESSGFTPINGRQVSPPSLATLDVEDHDSDVEFGDADDAVVTEEEMTEAIDDDFTLTVVAPRVENDTLTLQASHDDSETEMLRKFVTRVTADKNAKAAAAAAALAKKSTRPKRRSGSTGSSATGSPMAKTDSPHKRTPLGEKDTNSPSPVKKRKHGDEVEKGAVEGSPDADNAPKLKRRRKRVDPVLDSSTDSPDVSLDLSAPAEPGPRRSARTRSSRVALKPTGPSANSVALSLIPVRLPGMGAMDEATMDAQLSAARARSEEKDITAITRVNTRKNKGSAIHPKFVLARQAEDPAAWRMRELKIVFDAKESRSAGASDDSAADGRKSRKAKGVRWAEELVRYQGDEAPSAFKALATSLLADIMDEEDEEDPLAPSPKPAPVPAQADKAAEKPPSTPAKKALPRRTRSSRLLAPKPVDKVVTEKPAASPAPPPRRVSIAKSAAPASAPAAAPTPKMAMGTRRSKIAKLGMGVNGTPAPKRRGRAAV